MAATEDNFRVEVWTLDGATLVETISRSSDFTVSIAAWFAAIRRRPGMLLIHRNANHVMERMTTPGSQPEEPSLTVDGAAIENFDIALRDLRSWHRLRAMCTACLHHKPLDVATLTTRFGGDVLFNSIERKLRCSKCHKGSVRLEVHSAPRD